MKLNKKFGFLIATAILALIVPGTADAGKIYLGANVGQSSADISASDFDDGSFTSSSVDDSDTAFKGYVGYRFLKFFALEADFIDIGEISVDAVSDGSGLIYPAGPVTADAAADGIRLSALGILPVGESFSIFARFGFFDWDATISDGVVSASDSGNDEFFGAGVAWDLKGPITLRFEYEALSLDDLDIDVMSVGAAFRF